MRLGYGSTLLNITLRTSPSLSGPNSRQPRSSVAAAAATQSASNQRPGSATSFILADGTIDYYELLGVDDIATPAEIKMAYRSLAKVRKHGAG
jgi:hypothetical protein